MERSRFDRLAVALAGDDATRRRVLGGVAGGGLAALLGNVLGDGRFGALEADAKNRRRRRRRRRRNRNNQVTGVPITNNVNLFPAGQNLTELTVQQVLDALGLPDISSLTSLLEGEGVVDTSVLEQLGGLLADDVIGLGCDASSVTILSLCQTGFCDEDTDTCAACPDEQGNQQRCDTDDGLVCCVEGFICVNAECVLDVI
jgi:hypothetical protein